MFGNCALACSRRPIDGNDRTAFTHSALLFPSSFLFLKGGLAPPGLDPPLGGLPLAGPPPELEPRPPEPPRPERPFPPVPLDT